MTVVYGPDYIKSSQGILKICEILSNFIGFMCVVVDGGGSLCEAFLAGTMIGLIIAIIMFLLHVGKAGSAIEGVLSYQIYYNIAWFIYLLIVSSILLSKHWWPRALDAGGAFGIISAILYLIDAFDCYRNNPTLICVQA